MAHQQTRRRQFHDRRPFPLPVPREPTLAPLTRDELERAYSVFEALTFDSDWPNGAVAGAHRVALRLIYREILRAETVPPSQKPVETTSTPVAASVP